VALSAVLDDNWRWKKKVRQNGEEYGGVAEKYYALGISVSLIVGEPGDGE